MRNRPEMMRRLQKSLSMQYFLYYQLYQNKNGYPEFNDGSK